MVRDSLPGWGLRAQWVPREQNVECDALANDCRPPRPGRFHPHAVSPVVVANWRLVLAEFARRFLRLAARTG